MRHLLRERLAGPGSVGAAPFHNDIDYEATLERSEDFPTFGEVIVDECVSIHEKRVHKRATVALGEGSEEDQVIDSA